MKTVNLANGHVVGKLTGHEEGESVEALVFVDVLGGQGGGKGVVLVSGGTDGKGFVWDLATGRVRAELKHDVSISPHLLICPLSSSGSYHMPPPPSFACSPAL